MLTNEKIIYYTQAYLFIVKKATVNQIAGFLLQSPFKFQGGNPSTEKVTSILSASSLFHSYRDRSGFNVYELVDKNDSI